jgi:hypothetical protein
MARPKGRLTMTTTMRTSPATSSTTRSAPTGAAGGAGAVYGIGFIGALIYYIQYADSFVNGLYGVFQAIFWPGYLVYELLKMAGA